MRDTLNKSLELLIWIATGFLIVLSVYGGAVFIRFATEFNADLSVIFGGFLFIVFGITMSFVFAGICFQIMDIRTFTKHTALSLKRTGR
ncbi:MAG: hypothetical protein NXH79_07830 [Rhodobacteraceae bacterium]|nr:hypothetical protein [Paracoccaceae bacterium]